MHNDANARPNSKNRITAAIIPLKENDLHRLLLHCVCSHSLLPAIILNANNYPSRLIAQDKRTWK